MKLNILHKNTLLKANATVSGESKKWVVFLCGGSLSIGKERFSIWQNDLKKSGVSSIAFDYIGVPGTRDTVKNSSLQSRMEEVESVLSWIKSEFKNTEIIIFGVSMGGYIALGISAFFPKDISALILQAPAAYTQLSHNQPFDTAFTTTISQSSSWNNSFSFSWMHKFKQPILFFQPKCDEVIPDEITKQYLSIGNSKSEFTHVQLNKATHKCWSDSDFDCQTRRNIAIELIKFVKKI